MLNIYKQKKSNIKKEIIIKKEGVSVKDINYSPAHSREWVNSIYTFNKNTLKSLPSLDVYASKLIKSYFNLFSSTFEKKAMLYNTNIKNRISKVNRIFVAKPEFKHTNDKVTITLYIYNLELITYLNKMRKIKGLTSLNIFVSKGIKSINNKMNNNTHKLYIIRDIYTKFLASLNALNVKYLNKGNLSILNMEKLTSLNFIKVILAKLKMYLDIKKLIHLNKSKFNSIHILFLRNSLKKIYGKDVEFNIVSLKRYNINSSILTQILNIKLKKRTTKFSTIMTKILSKVKIPYKTLLHIPLRKPDKWNRQNLIIRNTLSNNYVKKVPMIELSNKDNLNKNNMDESKLNKVYIKRIKNDNLNNYIKYLYPQQYLINMSAREELYLKSRNLENTVLENMKNKIVSGIRVEASGRLSRRLSGRASYDLKQKGTTRNVYASYKGISSVLLRGDLNYNVDYIKTDYKGVLGSFGLKGWISSI